MFTPIGIIEVTQIFWEQKIYKTTTFFTTWMSNFWSFMAANWIFWKFRGDKSLILMKPLLREISHFLTNKWPDNKNPNMRNEKIWVQHFPLIAYYFNQSCWCTFLIKHDLRPKNMIPLDEIDEICRLWSKCHECSSIDRYGYYNNLQSFHWFSNEITQSIVREN